MRRGGWEDWAISLIEREKGEQPSSRWTEARRGAREEKEHQRDQG